jgi:SAM-dependent methyltransferase
MTDDAPGERVEDPFGRAIRDHHEGTRESPLYQRDGPDVREHPVEEFYFGRLERDPDSPLFAWLDGPVLEVGCGAGQHALGLQEECEVVATDVDPNLVAVARDRGVEDARAADMFDLRSRFERGGFRSVLSYGTQAGLAGSVTGLGRLLADLAYVTDGAATAVVDFYDPDRVDPAGMLGYRADPEPGLAHRVMSFEYEGDRSPILHFRLFSPDRMREAAAATPWELRGVRRRDDTADHHYLALLAKADAAVDGR